MKSDSPGLGIFEYQPPGTLNQAAPVQNTWYPILGTILAPEKAALLYMASVNVEDADETLECQIIADGVTIPAQGLAATHSTIYSIYLFPHAINRIAEVRLLTKTGAALATSPAFLIEAKEIQVQLRKTTALGAGNLTGIALWGKKKHV